MRIHAAGYDDFFTAQIVKDCEIIFGTGYLPPKHAVLRDPEFGDQIYYITIGYLPFLETTWSIVRSDRVGKKWGIGDRVACLRFKLLSENQRLLAIFLGLHDPFGIVGKEWVQHFCASYLVFFKKYKLKRYFNNINLHLGYGTDWIKAAQHQFVGLYEGISIHPNKSITFMFEHDTEKFNCGVWVVMFRHVQILLAFLNFNTISVGISYKFRP